MRNKLASLCLGAALVTILPACNDDAFLTENPRDFVGPSQFYRNAGDAVAAVNSIYASFINGTGDNYYGRNFWMIVEYPTETLTAGRLSGTNERSLPDNYALNPTHSYLETTWTSAYGAINRANAVLDHVPGITMDAALKNRLIGEAKFLRALHYFNLVRLFGGVPLRLHETSNLDSLAVARSTDAEVYAAIVQDLQDAIAAPLPAKAGYVSAENGRATIGAARTLLGKVYIQRAGTGVTTGAAATADYAAAQAILTTVATSGEYSLVANPMTLWDFFGGTVVENNNEVIFEIQNVRASGLGGRMSSHMAPVSTAPYLGAATNGSVEAELNFYQSYAAGDLRLNATWVLTWNKGQTPVTWSATASNTTNAAGYGAHTPFPRKYLDVLMPTTSAEEPNMVILRYADVLLMLAEAINEQAGPTAAAQGYINQVRTRAGIGNLPAADVVSAAAFKDAIFRERRWELVGEGHGHFDSVRHWAWAKARIEANLVLGRNTANGNKYPRPNPLSPCTGTGAASVCTLTNDHKLFPIPQRARDINPLLTQNPGWGTP